MKDDERCSFNGGVGRWRNSGRVDILSIGSERLLVGGGLGGRVVPTDRRSAESALELQFVYLSKVTALHLDITLI